MGLIKICETGVFKGQTAAGNTGTFYALLNRSDVNICMRSRGGDTPLDPSLPSAGSALTEGEDVRTFKPPDF